MKAKIFEILDIATYIPVLAVEMLSDVPEERRHLRRTGYAQEGESVCIMLTRLTDCESNCNPYSWDFPGRTMRIAHQYIRAHFNELDTGEIIDVEFILGETLHPKKTDCLY